VDIVNKDAEENDVIFSSELYYGCKAVLLKGEKNGKAVLKYFHLEVEAVDLKTTLMEVFEKVESLKLDNLYVLIDVMPNHVGRVKDIIKNSEYASILDANKERDILVNGIMYKKGGQDRETQIFGTKEGFVIIDAGKDTYVILWDDIELINQDESKNRMKPFLFKKRSIPPAENSSLASNETILNSETGQSFDDIWKWIRKYKLIQGMQMRDPRELPILSEEKEFSETYAKKSLKELQDVLVDLIKAGIIEGCEWILKTENPLQTFIDSLNTVDYDATIQRIKSADSRIEGIKTRIKQSKKKRSYVGKKKLKLNAQLVNACKYRSLLRELTSRWRKPDKSINLLGIIKKPGSEDTSL